MTDSGTPDDSPDTGREIQARLERVRSRNAGGRKRPSRAKGVTAAAGKAEPVEAPVAEAPVTVAPEPTPEPAPAPMPEPASGPLPEAEQAPTPEPAPTPTPAPLKATVPTPLGTTAVPPARKKPKGERRVEMRLSGSRSDNKERQVRREFIVALVAAVAAFGAIWVATGALGR